MRTLTRICGCIYTQGLNILPSDSHNNEMAMVFGAAIGNATQDGWQSLTESF